MRWRLLERDLDLGSVMAGISQYEWHCRMRPRTRLQPPTLGVHLALRSVVDKSLNLKGRTGDFEWLAPRRNHGVTL